MLLFFVKQFVIKLLLFVCVRYDIKLQFTVAINCKPFIIYLLCKAIYIKKFKLPLKKNYVKLRK